MWGEKKRMQCWARTAIRLVETSDTNPTCHFERSEKSLHQLPAVTPEESERIGASDRNHYAVNVFKNLQNFGFDIS
jgi:hypothetical protein